MKKKNCTDDNAWGHVKLIFLYCSMLFNCCRRDPSCVSILVLMIVGMNNLVRSRINYFKFFKDFINSGNGLYLSFEDDWCHWSTWRFNAVVIIGICPNLLCVFSLLIELEALFTYYLFRHVIRSIGFHEAIMDYPPAHS